MKTKDHTTESGIVITDAKHIVDGNISIRDGKVNAKVDVYADTEKPPADCYYILFDYQGGNVTEEAESQL